MNSVALFQKHSSLQFNLIKEHPHKYCIYSSWPLLKHNCTHNILVILGRLVFHGKGFVDSYYNQIEETQPYIDWFIKDRLDKWLGYLEKALAYNNGGNGWVPEWIHYLFLNINIICYDLECYS